MVGLFQVIPVALLRFWSFHSLALFFFFFFKLTCQIRCLKPGFVSLSRMALQSFLQDYRSLRKKYLGKETLTVRYWGTSSLSSVALRPDWVAVRQGEKKEHSVKTFGQFLWYQESENPILLPSESWKTQSMRLNWQVTLVISGRGVLTFNN